MCFFKITCFFSVFLFGLSSLSMPSLSSVHFCTSLSPLFVFSSIYLPLSFHSPFLGICPNVCLLVSSCGSRFCSLSVLELIHLESVLKHQPGAPSLPPFVFFILLLYFNPVLFQSVAFLPFLSLLHAITCWTSSFLGVFWCASLPFSVCRFVFLLSSFLFSHIIVLSSPNPLKCLVCVVLFWCLSSRPWTSAFIHIISFCCCFYFFKS